MMEWRKIFDICFNGCIMCVEFNCL